MFADQTAGVRAHAQMTPREPAASRHLLAAMANKPPMSAPLLDLMNGYATGAIPTRPANPTHRFHGAARRREGGRYLRMPYQRAPDRPKAVMRRKRLALTDPVPARIGAQLTEAERAFARLVRDEWERHGVFDLCHDEAAARVGTCSKTIQRAQDRLQELALISVELRPQPGRKNLPNVLRIISPQWLVWIERGPKRQRRMDRWTRMSSHGNPSDLNPERLASGMPNPLPGQPKPRGSTAKRTRAAPRARRRVLTKTKRRAARSGARGLAMKEEPEAQTFALLADRLIHEHAGKIAIAQGVPIEEAVEAVWDSLEAGLLRFAISDEHFWIEPCGATPAAPGGAEGDARTAQVPQAGGRRRRLCAAATRVELAAGRGARFGTHPRPPRPVNPQCKLRPVGQPVWRGVFLRRPTPPAGTATSAAPAAARQVPSPRDRGP